MIHTDTETKVFSPDTHKRNIYDDYFRQAFCRFSLRSTLFTSEVYVRFISAIV